jgi:type II secretory pathway component HofQ
MPRWTALAAALAVTGCASPSSRPVTTSADLGAWLTAEETSPARSTVLSLTMTPAARGPVTLPERVAAPPRPRRGARIDVSFQQAAMGNAFQLLADAGRFNLVMQEGLTGRVSVTMRGVDPYDALVALAEANGVEVRREGDMVLVTRR